MKLMFWTLLICFLPNVSIAKTMEFSQIWEVAKNESYQVQKSKIDKDLAETQNSRMKWHWTPSVYVRAGYMKTDNAGQSFFANMSQRAADPTTDFGPTNLNNPDDTSLTETTLGVAWPLYEGGKYRQLKKSTDEMLQAQIYFEKGQTQKLKTDLISAYAEILNHQKNLDDIQPLIKDIEKQLASYQVGKKSNPVGYSGLLGLKATYNKAMSYKRISEMQIHSSYNQIQQLVPSLEKGWEVVAAESYDFLKNHTPLDEAVEASYFLKGQEHVSQALNYKAKSEKSIMYPNLGVFAESSHFSGDRDSADSYSYGAYLKWNVGWYSKGQYREARLKESSNVLTTKMKTAEEVSAKDSLHVAINSLETTLKDMKENKKLLNEQLIISKKLFKNGAINAIQLSGLYANIVDVYWGCVETHSKLIEARTQYYLLTAR